MDKLFFTSGIDIAVLVEEREILNMLLSDVAAQNQNSIERLVFEHNGTQYVDYSLMFALIYHPIEQRLQEKRRRLYALENTEIEGLSEQDLAKLKTQYDKLSDEYNQEYTICMLVKFQARRLSAIQEELTLQVKYNTNLKKELEKLKDFNKADEYTIHILIDKIIEFNQKNQGLKRQNAELCKS